MIAEITQAVEITDSDQFTASGLFPQSCVFRGESEIILEAGSHFHCGPDTIFEDAHIGVKPGGSLSIGTACMIKGLIVAEVQSHIQIGDRLICNKTVDIRAAEGKQVQIGQDCLFANPRIYNSDFHAVYDRASGLRINPAQDVWIDDHVWLALNCVILKGSRIGRDTVVGAGSVVSGQFGPNLVLSGNPARMKRENVTWTDRAHAQIAMGPDPAQDMTPNPDPASDTLEDPVPDARPDLGISPETRRDMTSSAPPALPPKDARAELLDRIDAMRTAYRTLMEDCVSYGKGDPEKFIDMGIPQSQLFMTELLPFIHRAYLPAPTNALKTVLDIGPQSFGGTKLLYDLHNTGTHNKLKLQITAVDIVSNFEMLQKLMVPQVEFLIQDIFSVQNRHWDFVICSHVVEHVPDPMPFLARCQALARDFVLVACPWEEFPLTTKGHVNTINHAFVKKAGGKDLKIYRNYMWGKKREVCIFMLDGTGGK